MRVLARAEPAAVGMTIECPLDFGGGRADHERRAADGERRGGDPVERRAVEASGLLEPRAQPLDEPVQRAGVLCDPHGHERVAGLQVRAREAEHQGISEQWPDVLVVVDPDLLEARDRCRLGEGERPEAVKQGLSALDRGGVGIGRDAHQERAVGREVGELGAQRAAR